MRSGAIKKSTVGKSRQPRSKPTVEYTNFDRVNGLHSYKQAAPGAYVDYRARKRHGGKVAHFNFRLAKEMGLISPDHKEEMNSALSRKLLETFSIQIINEYDIQNNVKIPDADLKPHSYMATRYLQLQHPNKQGKTSGDGRSVWNGEYRAKGVTWDLSSCGTGATKLSPATAIEGKFFKTGDKQVSYGCGYNDLEDAIYAGIMSEIFHKNGIATERTLCVIEYKGKLAISVRAAKSLLRPSHFFAPLKQGNYEQLKGVVDYYYDRQVQNGEWPNHKGKKRYEFFAEEMARVFSRTSATFESEYIFCWLDWDGDNILVDGGIIDYGSVRQFGLYHSEYRYDDVDRFSTNIPEQRLKARYIVQTFAQIRDFLIKKRKDSIKRFEKDSILELFDRNFEVSRWDRLLHKVGFAKKYRDHLLKHRETEVEAFRQNHAYFEKAKASRGVYKVADGVTCDAVYCMRDIMRELPKLLVDRDGFIGPEEFTEIIASSYAKKKDVHLTPYKRTKVTDFQKTYLALVEIVAKSFVLTKKKLLGEITMRSSIINRYDRITGDGALYVTDMLLAEKKKLSVDKFYRIIDAFINYQILVPSRKKKKNRFFGKSARNQLQRIFDRTIQLVSRYREGF